MDKGPGNIITDNFKNYNEMKKAFHRANDTDTA